MAKGKNQATTTTTTTQEPEVVETTTTPEPAPVELPTNEGVDRSAEFQAFTLDRFEQIDDALASLVEGVEGLQNRKEKELPTGVESVPSEQIFNTCLQESIKCMIAVNSTTVMRDSNNPERMQPIAQAVVKYAHNLHEAIVKEMLT